MAEPRVVLVADDPALAQAVQTHLRSAAGLTAHAASYGGIAERLTCDSDGLLLLGVTTAAEQSLARQLVQQLVLQKWPVQVVVLDGHGRLANLDRFVSRRLHWPDDADRLTALARELDRGRQFRFADAENLEETLSRRLLALTPSLLPLADRIALGASHDVTVLINGETGTGKTYLARLMHDYSPRRQHRFMAIPCGAITANLIESEFFGHVKGSFTGADRTWAGRTGGSTVLGFALPTRAAVDEMYADLTSVGGAVHQPPYDAFFGARYAIVDDPDGNPVALMSPVDPERRYWPPRQPPPSA